MVGITWGPGLPIVEAVGTLYVEDLIAGRSPVDHRQRVEEGLDDRPRLTAPVRHHVVLELGEVDVTHIGQDVAVVRVHRYEARAEDPLHVADRVEGRHHRITLTTPRPDLHLRLAVELCTDLRIRQSVLLAQTPAFRLADGTLKDLLALVGRDRGAEGVTTTSTALAVEGWLEMPCEVLLDGLLSVALHGGVDRRIDLQPVRIDIVWGAVRLAVLITPAVEWVRLPLDAVVAELIVLPRSIVAAVGLIRHHDLTQVLTEVGGYTLLVVHAVEGCLDGEA